MCGRNIKELLQMNPILFLLRRRATQKNRSIGNHILFDIGCEVEIKYFDLDNNKSPIVLDSLPTGEWVTFTLKK